MPVGIIRDPKMNNQTEFKEKDFGVLYSENIGYLGYDKKNNNELRFITTGTIINFTDHVSMNKNEHFIWDGITITEKVVEITIDGTQGPVVSFLNDKAKEFLGNRTPPWE